MSKIIVKDRDGKEHILNAEKGLTLMEIIRDSGLDIEALCGGCAACATCHVYIGSKWIDKLPKIQDDEESMLDQTFDLKPGSRLACQIEFIDDYNDIFMELAPK